MKLSEMNPGDIVAIAWPENDHDDQLAGTEQFVQIGNVLGGKKKGTQTHTVLVTVVDRDTLLPLTSTKAWRALSPSIDVVELIERSRYGRGDGDGAHAGEDFADPLQGRRR